MLYRFLQFFRGLKGRVTAEDRRLLQTCLTEKERRLFHEMSVGIQVHSLYVAKTLIRWRQDNLHGLGDMEPFRWRLLLKGALLHDIGKPHDLTLSERAGIVLYQKFKRLFKLDIPFPYRKDYLENLQHPLLGGTVAEKLGLEPEVVEMIREHHGGDANKMSLSRYIYLADRVN